MLFDKNGFYYIDNNGINDNNYDFAVDIMNGNAKEDNTSKNGIVKLYDIDEAFIKGNAYPNLYKPYKNYVPSNVKVDSQRERALLEIQKLDFMINELNLYLDLYPDDESVYRLFKEYVDRCKKKKEEYTRTYGPIMLEDLTNEYEWSTGVWPWEEGAM